MWTGSEMLVWGGATNQDWVGLDTGGRYDPATDTWAPVNAGGAPSGRTWHTAVWNGSEMVVWGGCSSYVCCSGEGDHPVDHAAYDPTTDAWRAVTNVLAPMPRGYHQAVGASIGQLIVWGGLSGLYAQDTGGLYCSGTSTAGSPGAAESLVIGRGAGGMLEMAWGPGCGLAATDYNVYEGTLGEFAGHATNVCSTGGTPSATVIPGGGSSYFLVVPRDGSREGSYGTDSQGAERVRAASACVPEQLLGECGH